jgi:cbb3-type cytochrome oxidase maturation protein
MNVLLLLILVSVVLAGAAVAAFVWTVHQGDYEHIDRLAVLPFGDDDPGSLPKEP